MANKILISIPFPDCTLINYLLLSELIMSVDRTTYREKRQPSQLFELVSQLMRIRFFFLIILFEVFRKSMSNFALT